jgi:hypothetical protein
VLDQAEESNIDAAGSAHLIESSSNLRWWPFNFGKAIRCFFHITFIKLDINALLIVTPATVHYYWSSINIYHFCYIRLFTYAKQSQQEPKNNGIHRPKVLL